MVNSNIDNNNSKKVFRKEKGVNNAMLKGLILDMGVALTDAKHQWSNKMKTAYNKAVLHLEKQKS
jgi:hypothetical protein